MRSEAERRPVAAAGAALALLLAVRSATAQDAREPPAAETSGPTPEQIDDALVSIKADPNLALERNVHTLKWRSEPPEERASPGWVERISALLGWIGDLFEWVAQTGRVLVWVVVGLLGVLFAGYLARILRAGRVPQAPKRFVAPSHVRDLDIRPESLPDDVGAAAAALWDRGEQRAALALLYRGLLSRLVHAHGVPIRDSSTEGDCLALAVSRVGAVRNDYAVRLVGVWQGAVYGTEQPAAATVHSLCADFARALDAAPAAAAAGGAAAR